MNPFLVFLILIPLLGTLVLIFGLVLGLKNEGPVPSIILAILFFVSLLGFLVWALKRALSTTTSIIEFPGDAPLTYAKKSQLSNLMLVSTYLVLFFAAISLFKFDLKYFLGILSIALSLSMNWAALKQFRASKFVNTQNVTLLGFYKFLLNHLNRKQFMRNVLLPYLLVISFFIAYFKGSFLITAFDIAGIFYLLVSFSFWAISANLQN